MKVLVADDDRFSRIVLSRTLRAWGYEVEVAEDGAKAAAALCRVGGPTLGIIDWMMPGLDGPEVCRRVRELGAEPYRYLMLLTSKSSRDDLLDGLNSGADEYLSKPFDPLELQARLRIGRRLLDLQQELIEARDALHTQATRDGLTGVLNRTAILAALEEELARGARRDSGVGILLVDLDHFKTINDSHGHLAGDVVLQEAAARMSEKIRCYDRLGRYGGEEFLIVLPDCERRDLLEVAERVRAHLGRRPVLADDRLVPVTASIGASWVLGCSATDDLIRAADEALYGAKDGGRDQVVFRSLRRQPPFKAIG